MDEVFEQALSGESGIGFVLGRLVKEHHPGKALLDGVGASFDLLEFARAGRCEATLAKNEHAQLSTQWRRATGLHEEPVNAVYDVAWEGRALRVIVATWKMGWDKVHFSLIVGDDSTIVRKFAAEVCAYCNDPRPTVRLFQGGCWSRSDELWESIQASSFDELVLAGDLKERIQEDFVAFMRAKPEYERYGVPYKRGVLFMGPPGNGKTLCLRATIKLLDVPCLYVTSLKAKYATEDSNIDQVFRRAREMTPCCLVFEDIDAMIHDQNRAFFLNQLDGLGNLSGVLTLATTNHPERLDPAISERPSRFDRKYTFAMPGPAERATYLRAWNARLEDAMRIDAAAERALVDATHDFSFAYLKELYISAMMRWMLEKKPGSMAETLRVELRSLRDEMRAVRPPIAMATENEDESL